MLIQIMPSAAQIKARKAFVKKYAKKGKRSKSKEKLYPPSGKGLKEIGYIYEDNRRKIIIKVDKKYFRPNEVDYLRGNPKKAQKELNFKPKYSFSSLAKEMINEDLLLAQEEMNKKY